MFMTSTGVLMNNQMSNFAMPGVKDAAGMEGSPLNVIRRDRAPMSSMTPAILTRADGSPYLVLAGAGGPAAIAAVAQVTGLERFLIRIH